MFYDRLCSDASINYNKTIQDLEFKLEMEKNTNDELQSSIKDSRRSIDTLETEKIRKETELSNLRKDYADLSGLLEENLHSSARKDDLALDLKRKEREMRETVGIYNQQVSELEEKLEQETKSKDKLQSKISKLQISMEEFED